MTADRLVPVGGQNISEQETKKKKFDWMGETKFSSGHLPPLPPCARGPATPRRWRHCLASHRGGHLSAPACHRAPDQLLRRHRSSYKAKRVGVGRGRQWQIGTVSGSLGNFVVVFFHPPTNIAAKFQHTNARRRRYP